jgi:hypothetical protein
MLLFVLTCFMFHAHCVMDLEGKSPPELVSSLDEQSQTSETSSQPRSESGISERFYSR